MSDSNASKDGSAETELTKQEMKWATHPFFPKDNTCYISPFTHTNYSNCPCSADSKCKLCGAEGMPLEQLKHHCADVKHMQKVQKLRSYRDTIMAHYLRRHSSLIEYKDELEILERSAKKQCTIRTKIYQYFRPTMHSSGSDELLANIKGMLRTNMVEEKLTCVALAVWKSCCLVEGYTGSTNYFESMNWYRQGWKKKKADMSKSSAISIIPRLLLPFVGPSDSEDDETSKEADISDLVNPIYGAAHATIRRDFHGVPFGMHGYEEEDEDDDDEDEDDDDDEDGILQDVIRLRREQRRNAVIFGDDEGSEEDEGDY